MGAGGKDETRPSDEELDAIVASIDKVAPSGRPGRGVAASPGRDRMKDKFDKRLVPLSEIRSGGPKDGIPAIDAPRFATALDVAMGSPTLTSRGVTRR